MIEADGSSATGPLVSVVMPIYNRAHLVTRALGSVLAQTYQRFEVVIVDDASTDGLVSALREFPPSRLRVVRHSRNRGAAAARNTGVAAAAGEFIALLDSDDTWFPEKLAHQVAAMRDQPRDVAGHVCGYECVKTGYAARQIIPQWTASSFRRSQLFGCTCGPGTTLLCRREIFDDIGSFDENLRRLEDWDWILRLAEKGYHLLGSPAVLARVEVGTSASRRHVDAALQSIRDRHYPTIVREGATARRIFEATIYLESAAAAFGERDYACASIAALRSLARYPLRDGGFYWRLLQRVANPVRPSRGLRPTTLSPTGR
ncbi:MAG TPA: glycosyltransferase family 2 protein [Stellaceae bacterium]|nr:glycosyltransferase family 2 protein [Stellaceae bacterium]